MSRFQNKKPCPVPANQQPYNELQALKESNTFGWTTMNINIYYNKLLRIAFFCVSFALPLVSGSVNFKRVPLQFINLICAVACFSLILVLLRTYLGWSYVSNRLLSASISYEESGWYDGQIWVKTPEELVRDRLLGQYTVKPILERLKKTIFCVIIVLSINCGTSQLL